MLIGSQQRNMLTIMEMPSIFTPEDQSFTFYEGLNQHPDPAFKDKIVAELGCGNGWISIARAGKSLPLTVNLSSLVLWIFYFIIVVTEVGAAAVRYVYSDFMIHHFLDFQ